ncbi:hypothetical protein BU14_0973s0002 [Porphyra umbilicalis]|uniref:Uncharacterized protein n=1 Tax=Porphyra umbilicalis TaxID=2786 RepID=A0A1X6NN14_PORUM|nr:hypothetical protein BU14_0973s0002 [Porphyra umbilicalis]|eukprot:OSX69978.1 hypothetical protein BU14_0973s0002 [Porphyra umbilicalis]
MPLVCQWRLLLYSRRRPAAGVLVDCACTSVGTSWWTAPTPPWLCLQRTPPSSTHRQATHPSLAAPVGAPHAPPQMHVQRTHPPPSLQNPRSPARGLRRPPWAVSLATQRTVTKSLPTAPHRRARGSRQQPPPAQKAAGEWVPRSPAAGHRCPRSVDRRLAAPPPVGGPPARSFPAPRQVRNRPLQTRDSHGRTTLRRRRADPPHAPPTARSRLGLCRRLCRGTPHPPPACGWEGPPWVPCASVGPSAGRVVPQPAPPAMPRSRWRRRVTQRGSGPLW